MLLNGRPVPVQRGIRQGCPLSEMLYVLAIEPLLNELRQGLTGLTLLGVEGLRASLSAYADNVTVFIRYTMLRFLSDA